MGRGLVTINEADSPSGLRESDGRRRAVARPALFVAATLAALAPGRPAFAQYVFDPANADEQAKPGTLYFGSAKDDGGRYIRDVTVVLEGQQTSYVLITSAAGRFRGKFLIDAPPKDVKAACSKAGYSLLRVSKRLSAAGAAPSVQIDCILTRGVARADAAAPPSDPRTKQ